MARLAGIHENTFIMYIHVHRIVHVYLYYNDIHVQYEVVIIV